jgi:hypothetical protein
MTKCGSVVLFVVVVAFAGRATAQNSFKSRPSSSPATKQLTPKSTSAIQPLALKSTSPKRSPAPLPHAAANRRKTNTELARLEQQGLHAGGSKSGNREAVKSASIKPIGAPSRSGSGINASYQKPRIPQNKRP